MLPCFLTGLFEDDWPYILEVHIFRDSGWGVRASMEDPRKWQGVSGRKSQGGLLYPLLIQLASQEAVLSSMKMQNFSKQKCYFQSFCRHFHYWTSWSRVSDPRQTISLPRALLDADLSHAKWDERGCLEVVLCPEVPFSRWQP